MVVLRLSNLIFNGSDGCQLCVNTSERSNTPTRTCPISTLDVYGHHSTTRSCVDDATRRHITLRNTLFIMLRPGWHSIAAQVEWAVT